MTLKLKVLMAGCALSMSGFNVFAASNPASTNYVNSTVVGQAANGGVVFFTYLSGNVVHGLVAATADEPGTYTQANAIAQCPTKTENGYSDWVLPNKDQISALFNNRFAINPSDPNSNGGFHSQQTNNTNSNYWSSTVADGNHFYQNFFSGAQGPLLTATPTYYVRCIRAF